MKKEELKELMEFNLEKAKMLLLRDKKLMPVAFVSLENYIDIIALSFRDKAEKNLQLTLLKKFIKKINADAIIIISESWYLTTDQDNLDIEPALHPMRKECIFMYGECKEENITIAQIFETKDEEIVFGEKIYCNGHFASKFDFGIKTRNRQNKDLRNLN